jgi:hypothetical protein
MAVAVRMPKWYHMVELEHRLLVRTIYRNIITQSLYRLLEALELYHTEVPERLLCMYRLLSSLLSLLSYPLTCGFMLRWLRVLR